ncbi:MAG: S9 family peptidase [Gemmataceae bacterium]|nr:S9 family peptidase [Gemmataceae bacterium]
MSPAPRKATLLLLPVLLAAVLAPFTTGQPPAGSKKPLAVEDLYRIDAPTAPALAPDGKRLAYVRAWTDPKTKQDRHSLWLVEGSRDKARPMEKDQPDARAPVFSPDGKWIAFLSTRPRPRGWKQIPPTPPQSDPATDIWLIPAAGGPVIPLAGPEKPYGRVFNDGFYGRLAFSPDSRRLAFVAEGKDPRTPEEIANEVEIVRPDQGEGYTSYGASQVWVAHLDERPGRWLATRIERLTRDDAWYGDPQWSPDGQLLVVHANRTTDRESVRYSINKNFDLWAIDPATKEIRQLTSGPGPEVSPRFSPDGKRIACLSIPRKGSHRDVFNLAVVTLGEGGARTEILFDHHGPAADKPPHPAPVFPLPQDCWEGNRAVVYRAESGVGGGLAQVELATGKGLFFAQLVKLPKEPIEPTTVSRRALRTQQLTPAGNLFLKDRLTAPQKVVRWPNGEGHKIEGILTTPPTEVAKPPYKLLLYPHGGPHSRSALGFDFTVQVFAGHGYAVFQPNFRGSAGYGQKFIDSDRGDFGGGDMRDILTGIDQLVKQGVADRERQFVYGSSYGGFMTCWLVGQTNQFRAAVAQNAVTDLTMMWGLSDLQSWTQWEFGGRPWEVPAAMRKHSPLTHAARVKTPTLILHAREDRRCPLPMGRAFYQALVANGVPTQMVIYPNEGHGIRQPRHREDVLRRTLAWFQKHDRPQP